MQNTEHTAAPLLVRGGRVHDAVHPEPQQIDLLLENGRIVAMGHELNVPADIAVLDAAGLDIFPGFVDAHTHIGLDGYGIGYEGCDYNEMNDIWTPQLRAIDGINPRDPSFAHAQEAGITCVCTGPGSANVLGGTFTAIRAASGQTEWRWNHQCRCRRQSGSASAYSFLPVYVVSPPSLAAAIRTPRPLTSTLSSAGTSR